MANNTMPVAQIIVSVVAGFAISACPTSGLHSAPARSCPAVGSMWFFVVGITGCSVLLLVTYLGCLECTSMPTIEKAHDVPRKRSSDRKWSFEKGAWASIS